MKTQLKSLIAILISISHIASCSHAIRTSSFNSEHLQIDKGFQVIDPKNPPTDGVWATWKDSTAIANRNRIERYEFKEKIAGLERDKNIAENELQESQKQSNSLFVRYGFPIGFLCGLGASLAIFFAVKGK